MNKTKSPMGRTAGRHVEWFVPYKAGSISAKGYVNGKVVAQDSRETTGPPAKIALETEWPASGGVKADAADVALVKVSVLDTAGRLVPTAAETVSFALSGPGKIIGLGNGNPSSHEPDKPDTPTRGTRSAWNGLARVVLQSTHVKGTMTLTAQAPGLGTASLSVASA